MDIYKEITIGNRCSLCEKQLNWTSLATPKEKPIPLNIYRAICQECYNILKSKYK